MKNLMREIKEMARPRVEAGFDSFETIVAEVTECLEDDFDDDDLETKVRSEVHALFESQFQEQSKWPLLTDCDRLTKAFERLELNGILARENFGECQRTGLDKIQQEYNNVSAFFPIRGFVFYHKQGSENAVESKGIHLSYGSMQDAAKHTEIGREVQNVLTTEGLKTSWTGSVSERIFVHADWKRRRRKEH